jgi:hypothetical protein
MRPMHVPGSLVAAACVASILGACGKPPAPPATPEPASTGVERDLCEGSPPLPHAPLEGLLRNARCDQDLYYSMSNVADMLGVQCSYCHTARADKPVASQDRNFPAKTHEKDIANWMSAHLMQSVKPADGSRMQCSSCHTDEQGKPVVKILGEPRDRAKANEWMSLVMVKKFVAADGSRLRCKSCHVGTPGAPGFRAAVIERSEQLPQHGAASKGTPAF